MRMVGPGRYWTVLDHAAFPGRGDSAALRIQQAISRCALANDKAIRFPGAMPRWLWVDEKILPAENV